MAVTERGRPILTLRELVDVLAEELPRHLATGEDITDVREEID